MPGNQAPASAVPRPPASVTGEQVKRIRRALGWSQTNLATAMHVHDQTIARWERGVQHPSPLAVVTLRRVLMVPEVAAALGEALRAEVARMAATEPTRERAAS